MIVELLPDPRPVARTWRAPAPLPAPDRPAPAAPTRGEGVDAAMAALVRAVAEVATGQRTPLQLERWVDEDTLATLWTRQGAWDLPLSFVGLRAQHDGDAAEVAAHVRAGERHHALALRLERRRQRWFCTAVAWPPTQAGAGPKADPRRGGADANRVSAACPTGPAARC